MNVNRERSRNIPGWRIEDWASRSHKGISKHADVPRLQRDGWQCSNTVDQTFLEKSITKPMTFCDLIFSVWINTSFFVQKLNDVEVSTKCSKMKWSITSLKIMPLMIEVQYPQSDILYFVCLDRDRIFAGSISRFQSDLSQRRDETACFHPMIVGHEIDLTSSHDHYISNNCKPCL